MHTTLVSARKQFTSKNFFISDSKIKPIKIASRNRFTSHSDSESVSVVSINKDTNKIFNQKVLPQNYQKKLPKKI